MQKENTLVEIVYNIIDPLPRFFGEKTHSLLPSYTYVRLTTLLSVSVPITDQRQSFKPRIYGEVRASFWWQNWEHKLSHQKSLSDALLQITNFDSSPPAPPPFRITLNHKDQKPNKYFLVLLFGGFDKCMDRD